LDIQPCSNVSDDVAAIEQWAQIFKEPTTLVETLGKHWLIHQKAIKKDIAAEKSDWSAKNYFKAGADIADAVTLAVGPVEKEQSQYGSVENFEQLLAGFVYGLTGDNDLTEIEACFTGGEETLDKFRAALAELEAGHMVSGGMAIY